jgi:hypothetical protein
MRQEHSDEAYRLTIVASKATYIYGPYAKLSSARMMRTRQVKWVEKSQEVWHAEIHKATEWTLVD